jgi:hypothetical protein
MTVEVVWLRRDISSSASTPGLATGGFASTNVAR